MCTGICRNYSETTEVQGVPLNNVLGVCVYVQKSVGITVKPLKCKAYLLTMSLVCVCVCVLTMSSCVCTGICRNYSEITEVQGLPVDNVLGVCVCVDIGICRNYSETTEAQGIPVDNVFACIGITVKLLMCKVYLLTMSLCV